MAGVRNLHRIDLYCPEYMTNATILIDQNHHSGQPLFLHTGAHNYPTWEIPTRDHGSATLFKFWKREKA